MKKIFLILFLALVANCKAQERKGFDNSSNIYEIIGKDTIYSVVEEMPYLPDIGSKELLEHINREMVYPKEALTKGIDGQVVIAFVIDADGIAKDFTVDRSVYSALDKEAIRVLKSIPGKWIPGKHNGQFVKVKCRLPVTFELPLNIKSNKEIIEKFTCENLKEGLEFHIIEIEHSGNFDLKKLEERYEIPKIITENIEENKIIFNEIRDFSNQQTIDYYVSVIIGSRLKGSNSSWSPSWFLVFFDTDRNILDMFYYYP